MDLAKLQIDLRPRPNAQALELGFALLRSHGRDVYLAWLALWLPCLAIGGVIASFFPDYVTLCMFLAWWLKPLLERAPLYILSRQVFGESVTWRDALRAWPKQLGGGWFRMLTWWRPFFAGRGLYQPIWQLEGARGKVAAERRAVIGRDSTASAAYWFGVVCAHFEAALQFGLIAFIGIFLSKENGINPFAFLIGMDDHANTGWMIVITFICYGFAGGIIGPIYTSCCFTLYLNRRATLEAWDIEIMLRQIEPPSINRQPEVVTTPNGPSPISIVAFIAVAVFAAALLQPVPVAAALNPASANAKAESNSTKCKAPTWAPKPDETRTPDQSPEQAAIRKEVATLFDSDDLRRYVCEETWRRKIPFKDADKPDKKRAMPDLSLIAGIIKILLITGAILFVAWLLYRYRDQLVSLVRIQRSTAATEVGGLDIRAESLPDDIVGTVRVLWADGERRAALALLYRATLSRLVNQDGLHLNQGATEGDCLRLAENASKRGTLVDGRLRVTTTATELWLNGAYGERWPDSDAVMAACSAWQTQFGNKAAESAVRR